jgi:hypothetical protein
MAGAIFDSPKATYTATNNQIRIISDVVNLIDPMDTPLLSALGGLDSGRSKFSIRGNGTKIEWIEDAYAPKTATLGAAINQTVTSFTIATASGTSGASVFKAGHVIKLDDEYMHITAVDTTNNIVTVSRSFYSSTAATHATTSDLVEIVNQINLEGAAATFDSMSAFELPYNYTQIFRKGIKMTGTEQVIDQYGYGDVWSFQANKKMPEMFIEIEKAIFHGKRSSDAGTASNYRYFGGLRQFATLNNTTTTGTINKTLIDDVSEMIMNRGGNPDLLVLHPSSARDIKDSLDSSSFVNLDYSNTQLGMAPITHVRTQFGNLRLLEDRWCPKGTAWMLTSGKIGMMTLRPFGWRELGYAGDYDAAEVVGELTFALTNPGAHGSITGIVT